MDEELTPAQAITMSVQAHALVEAIRGGRLSDTELHDALVALPQRIDYRRAYTIAVTVLLRLNQTTRQDTNGEPTNAS